MTEITKISCVHNFTEPHSSRISDQLSPDHSRVRSRLSLSPISLLAVYTISMLPKQPLSRERFFVQNGGLDSRALLYEYRIW